VVVIASPFQGARLRAAEEPLSQSLLVGGVATGVAGVPAWSLGVVPLLDVRALVGLRLHRVGLQRVVAVVGVHRM
jgi:hypothetical protein